MCDPCICVDSLLCSLKLCNKELGDGKEPSVLKKLFLPITSVIDSVGYNQYADIWLAYTFGCFYTVCFFEGDRARPLDRSPRFAIETGNGKN